jgi:hypothetical protein
MSARTSFALAALLVAAAGCGTSGGNGLQPPIETLIYVSGPTTASFSMPIDDPDCPNSATFGSGIQSPNADHQFQGRTFLAPHLFVMENIRQPVQTVIKNTGSSAIRVDLYLGLNPQVTNFVIEPGTCQRVVSSTAIPQPTPNAFGDQIQVEICAPNAGPGAPNNGLDNPCITDAPTTPLVDNGVFFSATLGDIQETHITNCVLSGLLTFCQTPATFFMEQPKDEIDAIMNVNFGQNNGVVRMELYVNDVLTGPGFGASPNLSKQL